MEIVIAFMLGIGVGWTLGILLMMFVILRMVDGMVSDVGSKQE